MINERSFLHGNNQTRIILYIYTLYIYHALYALLKYSRLLLFTQSLLFPLSVILSTTTNDIYSKITRQNKIQLLFISYIHVYSLISVYYLFINSDFYLWIKVFLPNWRGYCYRFNWNTFGRTLLRFLHSAVSDGFKKFTNKEIHTAPTPHEIALFVRRYLCIVQW